MKIQHINATLEPEPSYNDVFHRLQVRVYLEGYGDQYFTVVKEYPIDYMKSIWDMLWEDIGKELKNRLLSNEEKKNAEITRRLAAREIEDDDGFGLDKE